MDTTTIVGDTNLKSFLEENKIMNINERTGSSFFLSFFLSFVRSFFLSSVQKESCVGKKKKKRPQKKIKDKDEDDEDDEEEEREKERDTHTQ